MASMAHRLSPLPPHPLLPNPTPTPTPTPTSTKSLFLTRSRRRGSLPLPGALVGGTYPMTPVEREREAMRRQFDDAYYRCRRDPMEGLSFTEDDMVAAIERSLNMFRAADEVSAQEEAAPVAAVTPGEERGEDDEAGGTVEEEIGLFKVGDTVNGIVYMVREDGAYVDIGAKSFAYLPLEQACLLQVKDMNEAGIFPGYSGEFIVSGKDRSGEGAYTVSLKEIQYELAWERCRQLQAEDVPIIGRVTGGNAGGVTVIVEGLNGFIPFSQISMKEVDVEDLIDVELPLKIVEVDEDQSRLVLSNRKAMADSQAQLSIGSVVLGTVESIKPYGAFIDIGGINGLLHVSQISHDRVADVSTVLQPGDTLKVMILSHDRERGRVSLSTKKLEPTPGDMIRNPEIVFEKADEMAQIFRQRIAQAEAMARADMLRFQPESGLGLSSDGILGPLSSDAPEEDIDFSSISP